MASPAPRSSIEIERKYDVSAGTEVPGLDDLPGVDEVEQSEQQLDATYYDTADLRLRAARITLRHRTGDADAGWHLKLPAGSAREELHVSGSAKDVPAELRALVRSVVRTEPLRPVARLRTQRGVYALRGPAASRARNGPVLVEIVDDRVEGSLLGEGGENATAALRWREWEAELKTAQPALLDDVEQRLTAAGALRSPVPSKVGRLLALRPGDQPAELWWATDDRPGPKLAAGSLLRAHLAEQVAELVRRDPMVRRDVPDNLHKMRVATRRLRSALQTFRPLVERSRTDPLRDELAWLAGVLGQVRDVEVMQARVTKMVAAELPDLVLGPVQRRVDSVLGRRYRTAHKAALAELDGERYLQLLEDLAALVHDPPFTALARERAGDVVLELVGKAWKKLDRVMKDAEKAVVAAESERLDLLLHDARKRAKAVRYAAESVAPAFGKPARKFAAAMEELQEVLGEHQDGVVTREVLRELGAGASRSGENGFTFGRLHALEQTRAETAAARWPAVRAKVSKPALRRWLG